MPIFEYACQDCGKEFEAFVTAERQPACPVCQGEHLSKLFSRLGMVGVSAGDATQTCASPAGPRACCGGACRSH